MLCSTLTLKYTNLVYEVLLYIRHLKNRLLIDRSIRKPAPLWCFTKDTNPMLPIVLDPQKTTIALVGKGDPMARRQQLLERAGVESPDVYDLTQNVAPDSEKLRQVSVLFIAGISETEAEPIAQLARSLGVLVNTEDVRSLCDFHVPASVRRGDLLLTSSTAGQAPGLSRRLRMKLEDDYGPEWADHLAELSAERKQWRQEGVGFSELATKSNAYIDQKGWLT